MCRAWISAACSENSVAQTSFTTADVAVAILNYNGAALLEQFLPSVLAFSGQAQIVVIDNDSHDLSVEVLQAKFPEVQIIRLDQNHGFCGGYNRGMQHIGKPITILLNSDVEVTEGWLDVLLEGFADDSVAAIQPKILAFKAKNSFEYAGAAGGFMDRLAFPYCRGRILTNLEKDQGQYDTPIEIDWATGACMAIRTELYKKLGGLDELFFAHMEEIDLCWRLRNQGYRLLCLPKSVVYHVGGATLGYESPKKLFLNHRNNLLMIYKNMSGWRCFWTLWFRLNLDGIIGASYLFSRGWNGLIAVLKAHYEFYRMMGRIQSHPIKHRPKAKRPLSILVEYYVKGRKRFTQLPSTNF